jgi:NADH:ubiquinone oxidoreductase subunit K
MDYSALGLRLGSIASNLAVSLFITAIFAFVFNGMGLLTSRPKPEPDFISLVICLELSLLSVVTLLLQISFNLDDSVGPLLALYILP